MAILDNYRSWFGVKHFDRRATFSGRVITPLKETKKYWQTNWVIKQRFYSTYHLSRDNIKLYLDNMNNFKPIFLDGYPSAFEILANYILSNNIKLKFKPKVIFVTAETLFSDVRNRIEKAFNCLVRNQYSSSEGAPFIVECEYGGNHFLPYSGVMEILDSDKNSTQDGECIFTCFHTEFMPLIRYQIGDYVKVSEHNKCPCGRNAFPLVETVQGRVEDYLYSPTRGKIGRLDPIFKSVPPSIIKSQIIQDKEDELRLLYVPDSKFFKDSHLIILKNEIISRFGNDMIIKFEEADEIPVGRNGKFKAVINNIDNKIY
jgi:phenylacetate-CoA ligase